MLMNSRSSDFDVRHNISANYLFELPFGRNKPLFGMLGEPLMQSSWLAAFERDPLPHRAPDDGGGNLAYNANYC